MEQSNSLSDQKKLSTQYDHTIANHNLVAPREVVPLVMELVKPQSVLDVGCGIGNWLKVFEEQGIGDYKGVDGSYLDKNLLKIPIHNFEARDLQQSFSLGRKFDLVVSLEVAEHLDERYADQFVQTLVNHGDIILFSAAIPGQGGQNHLNEQWPEYWQKKFEKHGFYFHDLIRQLIWNNTKVEWWYRQNIFLLTKSKPKAGAPKNIALVHPELFSLSIRNHNHYVHSLTNGRHGILSGLQVFRNSVLFKIRSLLNGEK